MNNIEKAMCALAAIAIVIVLLFTVASTLEPISVNCRRACAHCDGPAWLDCVKMCEDKTR